MHAGSSPSSPSAKLYIHKDANRRPSQRGRWRPRQRFPFGGDRGVRGRRRRDTKERAHLFGGKTPTSMRARPRLDCRGVPIDVRACVHVAGASPPASVRSSGAPRISCSLRRTADLALATSSIESTTASELIFFVSPAAGRDKIVHSGDSIHFFFLFDLISFFFLINCNPVRSTRKEPNPFSLSCNYLRRSLSLLVPAACTSEPRLSEAVPPMGLPFDAARKCRARAGPTLTDGRLCLSSPPASYPLLPHK